MFFIKKKRNDIFILFIFLVVVSFVFADNEIAIEANETCKKLPTSEFPEDLFSKSQRKSGAIILHIIFAIHCFYAIALVCTERFLPTINCLCEDLKLSDDVAAATFMSMATSAPELFSNIVGTFITESDIGIGHVIGNGYYNMFFVAAVGGIAASQEIILEWWPLARDCGMYTFVGLVLSIIVWDGVVQIYEALILLSLYFLYFLIMFNDQKIMNLILKKSSNEERNTSQRTDIQSESIVKAEKSLQDEREVEELEDLNAEYNLTLPPPPVSVKEKEENERWNMIKKIIILPTNILIRYTIPDVQVNKYRKYYVFSFIMCVVWIGISTYLGTWMISVIGETIGIPDLIMGMIFMAAGGSVVETFSVYYKAKKGECSIGLSNAIGCNNLDVTLCLALPWFIKTLPIYSSLCKEESLKVILESSLLHVNCLLLVISVIILYLIFYLNKFKLDKKLGYICGGVYAIILFIGVSIESYS